MNEKDDADTIKAWFEEAKGITLTTLPDFVQRVMDQNHDYGTVCHAVAACAVAAAWAANAMPKGGITGFQAGAVMWVFVEHWLHEKGPMKLVKYEDMLYPQYEDKFQRTIPKSVMEWLVTEAKEKLAVPGADHMHPEVRQHMEKIAEGIPPFGYVVRDR